MSSLHPQFIQKPTPGQLMRTTDAPNALNHLEVCQGFRSPVLGMESRANIRTRGVPSVLATSESIKVSGALCQELGTEASWLIILYLGN